MSLRVIFCNVMKENCIEKYEEFNVYSRSRYNFFVPQKPLELTVDCIKNNLEFMSLRVIFCNAMKENCIEK